MPQSSAAAKPSSGTPSAARQPVEKFTDGHVHVSIWENKSAKGAFRTASIQLRYKAAKKGWQTGTSYGAADLKHLETAAKEARARIEKWQQQTKAGPAPTTAA
jgi:hypothetical protein